MPDSVLITSAAGQTGTRLIRLLKARGVDQIRALVTRDASAEKVRALGAQPVMGDLRDGVALRQAMQDVETIYHIAPTLYFEEYKMHKVVLDAATASSIRHFVLHGVIAPYLQTLNFHWAKQLLINDLFAAGLPYTILLPTNFMQNINWTWPIIADEGRWELPYSPETPLSWVDLDDVAEAAANVITGSGDEYATYELVGTDSILSRRQIADLMTAELGRTVEAVRVDTDAYLAKYKDQPFFQRMTLDELSQIRAMFEGYDQVGCPAGNAKALSMLLGRPATSYRDFLKRLAEQMKAPQADGSITSYGLPSSA